MMENVSFVGVVEKFISMRKVCAGIGMRVEMPKSSVVPIVLTGAIEKTR